MQSQCCDGTRTSLCRVFDNGSPWAIPIFLGNMATTGQLHAKEIPLKITINSTQYCLGGLTYWNGVHFIGRLLSSGSWFDYDGMNFKNLLRGCLYGSRAGPLSETAR